MAVRATRGWLPIILVVAVWSGATALGQERPSPPAASAAASPEAAALKASAEIAARARAAASAASVASAAPGTAATEVSIRRRAPVTMAAEESILPSPSPSPFAGPLAGSPFSMMSPGVDPRMFIVDGSEAWRIWMRGEYLMWWVEGMDTPALVTSSPAGTNRDVAGVLGQPTTSILYGGDGLIDTMRPGGRFTAGYWFDWARFHGVEATFLGLLSRDSSFQAQSSGDPILARPFTNVEPGFEGADAELVAFPGLLTGRIESQAESSLLGIEVLYRGGWWQVGNRNFDFLAGWRYLSLDESLRIRDFKTSISTDTLVPVGTTIDELDSFSAKNDFNGAELGMLAHTRRNNWSLEVLGKLAFGNTRSRVAIDGTTTITVPGEPASTTAAGLLAQETNIGTYQRDVFSVVPEFGLNLAYHMTPNVQARVGYTFIYWNRVARPGDQIDTLLNLSQLEPTGLVGPARPAFSWVESGLWIQGISLGLEGRF
ncbi:MAG: BBP7 family outer membrane beta-barrel protein [Pirellulaceae bacterium]|nr:BBP7 family outer membrane beta-barrel protein [Pirellulaceae bacterium]